MYKSEQFGRIFWIDDNNDFKSCPLNVDGTGDFTCDDYVSDWDDWSDVNYEFSLIFIGHVSLTRTITITH